MGAEDSTYLHQSVHGLFDPLKVKIPAALESRSILYKD